MIRKVLLYFAGAVLLLAGIAAVLYRTNPAPRVPRLELAALRDSPRPLLIKVHAQWCPVCIVTKDIWKQVESAYSGKVDMVVFDITNEASDRAARVEAQRLGLGEVYDDYTSSTGTVYVLKDGRSKALVASIHGSRDFTDYRKAIDGALRD